MSLSICRIVNPSRLVISNIYYIKQKQESQFKKCLCLQVEPHKVLFSYLDELFELHYFSIFKQELENNEYIILKLIDSPGDTGKIQYNIQF